MSKLIAKWCRINRAFSHGESNCLKLEMLARDMGYGSGSKTDVLRELLNNNKELFEVILDNLSFNMTEEQEKFLKSSLNEEDEEEDSDNSEDDSEAPGHFVHPTSDYNNDLESNRLLDKLVSGDY